MRERERETERDASEVRALDNWLCYVFRGEPVTYIEYYVVGLSRTLRFRVMIL